MSVPSVRRVATIRDNQTSTSSLTIRHFPCPYLRDQTVGHLLSLDRISAAKVFLFLLCQTQDNLGPFRQFWLVWRVFTSNFSVLFYICPYPSQQLFLEIAPSISLLEARSWWSSRLSCIFREKNHAKHKIPAAINTLWKHIDGTKAMPKYFHLVK